MVTTQNMSKLSTTEITLKPVEGRDANELFPLVYHTDVTDTLCWNGPDSLEDYQIGLKMREARVQQGILHHFTIIENRSGRLIGNIDIRPDENNFRGDIGIWIGKIYQGKGYGAQAVRQILEYGFKTLGMTKIEACIYVGNWTSRRIFEKNGFILEGTIRKAVIKRGQPVDEWILGITREEYL
jgi:RimJ/RimL family protein N-acetyltransferase